MQVWPIYPEDVQRAGGHPAPFPVVLPQRLIMMYTFKECTDAGFDGDIVLDMFNGTGATCVAARALGRKWIGIDLHPGYCEIARNRVKHESLDPHCIMLEKVRVLGAENSRQLDLFTEKSMETTPIIEKKGEKIKQKQFFSGMKQDL